MSRKQAARGVRVDEPIVGCHEQGMTMAAVANTGAGTEHDAEAPPGRRQANSRQQQKETPRAAAVAAKNGTSSGSVAPAPSDPLRALCPSPVPPPAAQNDCIKSKQPVPTCGTSPMTILADGDVIASAVPLIAAVVRNAVVVSNDIF